MEPASGVGVVQIDALAESVDSAEDVLDDSDFFQELLVVMSLLSACSLSVQELVNAFEARQDSYASR